MEINEFLKTIKDESILNFLSSLLNNKESLKYISSVLITNYNFINIDFMPSKNEIVFSLLIGNHLRDEDCFLNFILLKKMT